MMHRGGWLAVAGRRRICAAAVFCRSERKEVELPCNPTNPRQ